MSIQLVVDMNLSVEWVEELTKNGWPAVHWSTLGDPRAKDSEIMEWARSHGHVVFTHDLDFGTALALTQATGPSVLQVRGQDVLPGRLARIVSAALHKYEAELSTGAIVVVEEKKCRVRVLPFKTAPDE